jgi:predicted GTPase
LYLANKAENGREGDFLSDYYQFFPQAATDESMEPLFISAEHGDGFQDLYRMIKEMIPETKKTEWEDRKEKRVERFYKLKD